MTVQGTPPPIVVDTAIAKKQAEEMSQVLLRYQVFGDFSNQRDAEEFTEGTVDFASENRSGILLCLYPERDVKLSLKFDVKNVSVDDNGISMKTYISSATASPTSNIITSRYYTNLNVELAKFIEDDNI